MIELNKFNVHKIVDSKEKAAKLISLGFSVFKDEDNLMGATKEEAVNEEGNNGLDYNVMTVEQLKSLCKENNLEGYKSLAKDDLIAFIKEHIKG